MMSKDVPTVIVIIGTGGIDVFKLVLTRGRRKHAVVVRTKLLLHDDPGDQGLRTRCFPQHLDPLFQAAAGEAHFHQLLHQSRRDALLPILRFFFP